MSHARETTHFICYIVVSPEAEIVASSLCIPNFDTLRHTLIIFGRSVEEEL